MRVCILVANSLFWSSRNLEHGVSGVEILALQPWNEIIDLYLRS